MQSEESVTRWIVAVRNGDTEAASQLWDRYFRQLMHHARLRMSNVAKTTYDEEDAALSTFLLLCRKLENGSYASVSDREELWHLMLKVLIRKIGRRVKYQGAAKRSDLKDGSSFCSLDELPADTTQAISQECFELISSLKDPNLEQVALLRFEGYTNDEIALKLNRTRRTVQRMLNLIRDLWEEELHSETD